MEKEILNWLSNGETGLSSKAMAFTAIGVECRKAYPSDPSDFNRCLKLVNEIPEIEKHFKKIADLSPAWASIIENWNLIKDLFLEEVGYDWSNGRSAPKTYALMKDVIGKKG